MRFVIAASLFVLSIIGLLLGIAERTVWAPPPSFNLKVSLDSTKPLIVVPNTVLSLHPGKPVVTATGSKLAFVADGRESDVVAWIGDHEHDILVIDEKTKNLVAESAAGVVNLESPLDSDLWRGQDFGEHKAQLVVSSGQQGAVLVASDGTNPAPRNINLNWPIAHDLTRSNILLIAGGVLLLAALVVNLLAFMHLRRSRGPRRKTPAPPKPPRYRFKRKSNTAPARGRRSARRNFVALPTALAVFTLLTGCVADPESIKQSPSPSVSASTEVKPPAALTAKQINRILAEIEQVAADADLVSDKKVLESRFTGPALQQRTAHYLIRSRSKNVAALPAIVAKPISFKLPAATNQWPRTLMVVTDESGDSALPQMLVLRQDSPRSKYMLWYNIRLMPGVQIPEVPAARVGAIPVDTESLFLKVPPLSLASAYGDVIDKGPASLSYGLFDISEDEFFKQVSESQKAQAENLDTGKITFKHALGDTNVISLATTDGGALVALYMTDTYRIKPKNRGSAVAVTGQEKIMLGADGSTRGIKSVYGDMLLFYVPALSETSRIKLLGVSQGLVSVGSL